MFYLIFYITLYICIIGFNHRAENKFILGLIPIYNIYLFFKIIGLSPIILVISILLLIFNETRMMVVTFYTIFLPFIIADAYGKNFIYGLLGLILPFLIFPYLAFIAGDYSYGDEKNEILPQA